MNRTFLSSLSVGVLGAVGLAGCAGPTSYKPTKVPEPVAVKVEDFTADTVLPAKVGDTWNYEYESVTQTSAGQKREAGKIKFTIDAVKDTSRGKELSLAISKDGEVQDKQIWVVNAKGITQMTAGMQNKPFNPPQPLLLLPIKDNMKFQWKGSGICPDGNPGDMKVTSEVRGSEPIDTAVGKDTALAVESNTSFKSSKLTALLGITTWYKPGVGIVRLKQALVARGGNVVTTLKLISGPK